jgi:hypothetical protein
MSAARFIPYALGATVLAGGLALGLWPRTPRPAPPPPVSASAAPSASASSAPDEDEEYVPDLSGPDVGELIVAGASDATSLGFVDRRLVWQLTDGATLGSARADGGDQQVLWSTSEEGIFGNLIATAADGVYWSLDRTDDEPEPIFFTPAGALERRADKGEPVASGASPDHLVAATSATGRALWFTDLGNVMRLSGGKVETMAKRTKRIATMCGDGAELYWFEAPYEGDGAHELWVMPAGGGEPKLVAGNLERRERDSLAMRRGALYWAEGPEGRAGEEPPPDAEKAIYTLSTPNGRPRRLARSGVVTALALDDADVVWAESHGSEEAPVSVLRALSLETGQVRRLGRAGGTVTALALDATHLFWSGADGIKRLARKAAAP